MLPKHVSFQLHYLTFFYLLTPKAGTSVGDHDNDKGQQHICTDDACYCPSLNSVARHSAVWQTGSALTETQRRGVGWKKDVNNRTELEKMIHEVFLSRSVYVLVVFLLQS